MVKNTNAYQHQQEIGGSLVKSSFVLRIKFSGGIQFCAPKSPTFFSCQPLPATVGDSANFEHLNFETTDGTLTLKKIKSK